MTPDEAISIVKSKANGRTRYEGQEPFLDEVLVAEIERLRSVLHNLERLRKLMDQQFPATFVVLDEADDAVSRAMKPAFEENRPEGCV